MSEWTHLLLTIAVAIVGSYIGNKLGFPAGTLIGAMCSVGVFQLVTGLAWFPSEIKTISSAIVGAYLGARVTRADLLSLAKIPLATIIMLLGMFGYNFICCFALHHVAGIDPVTGILASAPSGVTEMSLVALDVGANSTLVSSMQAFRLIAATTITPFLHRYILQHRKHEMKALSEEESKKTAPKQNRDIVVTLTIGLVFGVVGKVSGIPAGTICLPMIACACYNLRTKKGYLPKKIQRAALCCNGAIIGTRLLMKDLLVFRSILFLVIAMTVGWIMLNLALGWTVHRVGGLPLETALFATAAGGMSDMGVIASELGGNATQVSVMQMCRVVCVVTICPIMATVLG